MNKSIIFIAISFATIFVTFISCDKDPVDITIQDYTTGALIVNEGGSGSSNASISFYNPLEDVVTLDIFYSANNRPVGDLVQSACTFNDYTYIVANGSDKIEVVNAKDFTEVGVITGLNSPRYFLGINANKAYVTQWGDGGQVKVVDLSTNTVTKSIDVATGPERLAMVGDYVYVVNGGGWGTDSVLSIINTNTDEVETTLTIGKSPMDLLVDHENFLWVLCKGAITYDSLWNPIAHEPAMLYKINTSSNIIDAWLKLADEAHPEQIEISDDGYYIYYGAGMSGFHGIYQLDKQTMAVPENPLIDQTFYGFSVSANDGTIYACDAGDYVTNGTLQIYTPEGNLTGTYETGLIPNGVYFR